MTNCVGIAVGEDGSIGVDIDIAVGCKGEGRHDCTASCDCGYDGGDAEFHFGILFDF